MAQTLEKKAVLLDKRKEIECDLCNEFFTDARYKVYMKSCNEKCSEARKICVECVKFISQKNIQAGLVNCCPYRCCRKPVEYGKDHAFMQYIVSKKIKDFAYLWKDIVLPKQLQITFPVIQPKLENVIKTQRAIIYHFKELVALFKAKKKANKAFSIAQAVLTVLMFTPIYPVALAAKIGTSALNVGSSVYYGWSFNSKASEIARHFETLDKLEKDVELATFFELYQNFKKQESPKIEYAATVVNAVGGVIAAGDAIYSLLSNSISIFGNLLEGFASLVQVIVMIGENSNLGNHIKKLEDLVSNLEKTSQDFDKTIEVVKKDVNVQDPTSC